MAVEPTQHIRQHLLALRLVDKVVVEPGVEVQLLVGRAGPRHQQPAAAMIGDDVAGAMEN